MLTTCVFANVLRCCIVVFHVRVAVRMVARIFVAECSGLSSLESMPQRRPKHTPRYVSSCFVWRFSSFRKMVVGSWLTHDLLTNHPIWYVLDQLPDMFNFFYMSVRVLANRKTSSKMPVATDLDGLTLSRAI